MEPKVRLTAALGAILLLAHAPVAFATSVIPITDQELLARSARVVRGVVLSSEVVRTADGPVETMVVIDVVQTFKGADEPRLVLRQFGGVLPDGSGFRLWGAPEYKPGHEVIAFAISRPDGDYQTAEMLLGKFDVLVDEKGTAFAAPQLWAGRGPGVAIHQRLRDLTGDDSLDSLDSPRELVAFEALLRGSAVAPDALRGNPEGELRPRVRNQTSRPIDPQWANMTGTPRWTTPTATWMLEGTANMTGGGVAEATNALATWTNDANTNIQYSKVASSSNQIHLNAMTSLCGWSTCLSGNGVIGCGGPSTNGSSHTWRGDTYDTAIGGEVWLRCYSTTNQFSSTITEAVILHELGHTLGLGHSNESKSTHDTCADADESTAIMNATVPNRKTLGTDDQDGIRWLYGDGQTHCSGGPSCTPASVSGNPQSTTIAAGQATTLSVSGSGTAPLSYQWYVGASGVTSAPIAGATSSSVSVTPASTTSYWARISNSCGSANSIAATVTVVPPASVMAKFSISPTGGVAGQTLFTFTDLSSGSIASWSWTFGDQTTSSQQNPTHLYTEAGNYTVRLTVLGGDGTQNTATKFVTVTAPSPALSAAFSYTPDAPTTDTTIQFLDQSSGNPTTWTWNFGDGTSSNAPNPSKRFSSPGAYTVSLTVATITSSKGTAKTVTVAAVVPATPAVNADFEVTTLSPRARDNVVFADRSTGNPTSWSWDFGDGSTSSAQNPTHSYLAAGTYSVSLIAANASGPGAVRVRSVTVFPSIERFSSLVPVSAQTSGLGSTFWRTELTIFNAGSSAAVVDFRFIPGAGGALLLRSQTIPAGGSVVFQNALPDLFGLAAGAGAIEVQSQHEGSAPQLRVSSRTFTSSADGTYGQFVPDVETLPAVTYLAGVQSTAAYRTNVGFVNKSPSAVDATVSLLDSDGNLLGTMPMTLPGNNYQQLGVTSLFPLLAGQEKGGLTLKIESSVADAVSVYASTIDNRSQDPIFFPAAAVPSTEQIIIPGLARIPGAEGTFWRSDVTFFNPTGVSMTLSMRFLVAGQDNRNAVSRTLTLGPRRSATIEDVLTWMGAGNATGALLVSASGAGTAPIVNSRTYTTRASDGGTYGQWIDATETASMSRSAVLTGIRSDDLYRTNLGFVNGGDEVLNAAAELYSAFGQKLGTAFVQVPAKSQIQASIPNLFPGLNATGIGSFTIRAEADTRTFLTYGSMIDNRSGDPIFVKGK